MYLQFSTKITDGTTIHGAFDFKYEGDECLSDEKLAFYRHNLSELKLIIIDEVSLLSANMLGRINLRLMQIFQNKKYFGGVAVGVVGDILQVRFDISYLSIQLT